MRVYIAVAREGQNYLPSRRVAARLERLGLLSAVLSFALCMYRSVESVYKAEARDRL